MNCTSGFLKILKLKCPSKTRGISKFSKITRVGYSINCPKQTCGYWSITPNQHFVLKLVSFNSGQLQNNSFNGEMLITINRVINHCNARCQSFERVSFFDVRYWASTKLSSVFQILNNLYSIYRKFQNLRTYLL